MATIEVFRLVYITNTFRRYFLRFLLPKTYIVFMIVYEVIGKWLILSLERFSNENCAKHLSKTSVNNLRRIHGLLRCAHFLLAGVRVNRNSPNKKALVACTMAAF